MNALSWMWLAAMVLFAVQLLRFLLSLIKPKERKGLTLISLFSSLLHYVAAIVILCWGLSILGVNVNAIVASVGIVALIVGFGAESLVADVVTGIFLIFENQYNVGDIVEVNGFRGTVKDIGIRTTSIMDAGKNIITSNKALVANFYDELIPLAERKGLLFRCTAAVGGGIGWLSEVERSRRVQKLQKVGGIMNGTCNYILDSMTRLGLDYDVALKQAQALGYAEANPTTDVEGIDTWHKVILSSNIAFGISLEKETVPVSGISRISAYDVENFKAHGLVCKLISTGKCEDGKVSAYVQPTLVAASAPEANVPMNYNLITLVGEFSQRMSFFGQGAGRYPTAYNVVQDCADQLSGKGFYSPYGPKVRAVNDEKLCYYVRGAAWNDPAEAWGEACITKPVAVDEMHAWLKENPTAFIAAMPTEL